MEKVLGEVSEWVGQWIMGFGGWDGRERERSPRVGDGVENQTADSLRTGRGKIAG